MIGSLSSTYLHLHNWVEKIHFQQNGSSSLASAFIGGGSVHAGSPGAGGAGGVASSGTTTS